MNLIEYYIGIQPDDTQKLIEFMSILNSDIDTNLHVTVMYTYDDPIGYFTYCIKGTWESYKEFLNQYWLKSVNHFEE